MILQALIDYYDEMLKQGRITPPGWEQAKISYILNIDENGTLKSIENVTEKMLLKKRVINQPKKITLPAAYKRTSGAKANFLWDNAVYMLGISKDGNAERAEKCFRASAKMHSELLGPIDSECAKAICAFFDKWTPGDLKVCAEMLGVEEEQVEKNFAIANLTFRVNEKAPEEDPKIREAWEQYNGADESTKESVKMQSLITGKEEIISAVHPSIKGVKNAQSSGAALVSFNANAFCSYGHSQGYNAPIGESSVTAYTMALNSLLADYQYTKIIGNATTVYWSENAEPVYQEFAKAAFFGDSGSRFSEKFLPIMEQLANGIYCDPYDPDQTFYILGLSPNASRLSVRFFIHEKFGKIAKNLLEHYNRCVINNSTLERSPLFLWKILQETIDLRVSNATPNPLMAGALARALFMGEEYPAYTKTCIMMQIQKSDTVTYQKSAFLRGYYLKNKAENIQKEVLDMTLNKESNDPGYLLGRLFAVYEQAQTASHGIYSSGKGCYFRSAAATPERTFSILGDRYQRAIKKLAPGYRNYFENLVAELKSKLEAYPKQLSIEEQAAFDLGYYHQKQENYKRNNNDTEEDKNGTD